MSVKFKMESGVQLLARLAKKPSVENFYPILFQYGPISGDIIEITDDSTCSSQFLLIDIISEALIQTKLNGVQAGVLVFNTDGNLNYDELINVLCRKLSVTYSMLEKELDDTLANLHILNIYDATQLYTTIYNLETILTENPNISIMVFNTLTAFYWLEHSYKITKMDLYTKNLINTIQTVTKEYKPICIYTRPDYFCTSKDLENMIAEVNYQIQVLDNGNRNYQVNIKTSSTKTTKFFRAVDSNIKWI